MTHNLFTQAQTNSTYINAQSLNIDLVTLYMRFSQSKNQGAFNTTDDRARPEGMALVDRAIQLSPNVRFWPIAARRTLPKADL